MTLPLSNIDLEQAKFVDSGGNVCIRVVQTTATGNSSPLTSTNVTDLEYGKFVEDDNGDVAVVFLAV
jgi:hypothetical protein